MCLKLIPLYSTGHTYPHQKHPYPHDFVMK